MPGASMDIFALLLRDLGNASLAVIAIAEALIFAYGFWKEWWVPGGTYRRELERGNALEAASNENVKAAANASAAAKAASDAALADAISQLARVQNLGRSNESR